MTRWRIYKDYDYFGFLGWYGLVICPNCKRWFKFPDYEVAEQFVARVDHCPYCGEKKELEHEAN